MGLVHVLVRCAGCASLSDVNITWCDTNHILAVDPHIGSSVFFFLVQVLAVDARERAAAAAAGTSTGGQVGTDCAALLCG